VTWLEFGLASLVVFAGALVQGSIGFGANLVAGPFLIMIERSLVPGPALITAFVLTSAMWWRERASTDARGLRWGLLGRIPGSAAGAVCVALLPVGSLEVALGSIILLAVVMSVTRFHITPTIPAVLGAGIVSGFFTSTAAVGGPPAALVYQRMPGPVIRSTIAALATIGGVSAALFLAVAGELGVAELTRGAALLPALLLGLHASRRFARVLDNGRTRAAVLALCAASGAAVLLRGLT